METCSTLNANITTNIEIRDIDGNLLCQSSNTLTQRGISILPDLLSSTRFIDAIMLSQLGNDGANSTLPSDAIQLEIANYFSSRSSSTGALILNYEANATTGGVPSGTNVNSLGLVSDDVLFSVADTGFTTGDTPIAILYQINITLTNV